MGPDCGTALIDGVGLACQPRAAREHRRGRGVGTGLQAVTSAIHNLGGGICARYRAQVGAIC